MAGSCPAHARNHPVRYRAVAGFIVASAAFATIFVALSLSAFHAPAPHDLPVGIVGSSAATGRIANALDRAAPGGFQFRHYPSQASARTGIADREVDGALIASGAHLRLMVAQAGGTGPAQALIRSFGAVAARSRRDLVVTDVAPPLAGDTEALSPFFVVLGVLFPSLGAGSASALVFRRSRRAWCVAAPVAVAIVVGAVAAAVADGVAGLGNYAAIASVITLFSVAVAAPTAALVRIRPPLAAVAITAFLLFGIPASGGPANLASFGPGFLRVLSPALPLGVAAGAVRNIVYFAGHGTTLRIVVLATWAMAGLAGLALVTRDGPAQAMPMRAELPA